MDRRFAACLASLLVVSACGDEPKRRRSNSDDDAQTASSASSTSTAANPARSSEKWPIVEVDGTTVTVDGEPAGTTRAIVDGGRIGRIDELFERLKALRESFKTLNPDRPFPGVAGLRTRRDVPMLVFKSVFQTIAYAGYPTVSVQSIGSLQPIYTIDAQIPGPPSPDAGLEAKTPEKILTVHAREELMLVWRQGAVVVSETKGLSRDALAEAICKEWKESGSHRDPADPLRDQAILQADDKLGFGDVLPSLEAIEQCKREFRAAGGGLEKQPVFHVTFSIR